jgi:hypothetical protein
MQSLESITESSSFAGIESNDVRLQDTECSDCLKIHVSQRNKNSMKYISKAKLQEKHRSKLSDFENQGVWKVITPRAAYQEHSGFGKLTIINPNEFSNASYIFFKVNSNQEAASLKSYLETKLPNVMLSLRKVSHNVNPKQLHWIPLLPLDRVWTDSEVYQYLRLTESDIMLIEEAKIKKYHSDA